MRTFSLHLLTFFFFYTFLSSASYIPASQTAETENPQILMNTELGDITIELYQKKAPRSVANFLKYVNEKRYEGTVFYRVVRKDNQPENPIKIAVIQGGLPGELYKKNSLPPIAHETTAQTGILHKDGVISLARLEPGTATSEFFICVGDQPELDFGGKRNPDGQGFAAFGKVIAGMDVVRAIHQKPVKGQILNPVVKITGINIIKK